MLSLHDRIGACSVAGTKGEPVLIVGLRDGHIEIWELQSGSCVAVRKGHIAAVSYPAVVDGDDGGVRRRALLGSYEKMIRV